MARWQRLLPIIGQLKHYRWRADGAQDAMAAVLVTAMLIPQALAYALLAGLPVQTGLYASIVPLFLYALLGSSRTLSVGPMAVTSLMSAHMIASAQQQLGIDAIHAAMVYALMSGFFLLLLGLLRFGFVAKLIAQPVMGGFNNASVLVIVWPQLWLINDVHSHANFTSIGNQFHPWATVLGIATLLILLLGKYGLPRMLSRYMSPSHAQQWAKTIPLWVVVAAMLAGALGWLPADKLNTVGAFSAGLPTWQWPELTLSIVQFFALPAALMALVIYVNAISVGHVLAARHQHQINPNQELIGLGAANIGAAISGAFPVTGGFSRSAVNDDAGARSQMASIFTASLMLLSVLWLAPWFGHLPKTILAAMIIVSVGGMFDATLFKKLWLFDRGEWLVMMATFIAALMWRVDIGIVVGIVASFTLLISRSAKPHMAEIGRLPDSESFRNVRHYQVTTWPQIVSLRIDENWQFFNHQYISEAILQHVEHKPEVKHVIIQCHGSNAFDYSAALALITLHQDLALRGISLSLSEVKQPVWRQLNKLALPQALRQHVYLTHHQAIIAALQTEHSNPSDLS